LQQQIGRAPKVFIFQDDAAIPPGREWEKQIRVQIKASSFLIPIITPGFLQSSWCCQEVDLFRKRENELGRSDLIFPIHYVDTGHVIGDDPAYCQDDAVLRFLRTRQWIDFRPLRKRNLENEDVALKLEEIARAISTALRAVVKTNSKETSWNKAADLSGLAEQVKLGSKDANGRNLRLREASNENQSLVKVLKSGVVDGMVYSLYSDGSIEAQMPEGMQRFASIDELRAYIDRRP
jgi:hypothetical protein